jgi:hypothetical protein
MVKSEVVVVHLRFKIFSSPGLAIVSYIEISILGLGP